jgi:hypothetical protein
MIDSNLLLVSDELNSTLDFSNMYGEKSKIGGEENDTVIDLENIILLKVKTKKNKFEFYFKIKDKNLFCSGIDLFINKYNSFRFLFGQDRYILKGVNKTKINLNKNKLFIEVKNVKVIKE